MIYSPKWAPPPLWGLNTVATISTLVGNRVYVMACGPQGVRNRVHSTVVVVVRHCIQQPYEDF